MLLSLNGPLLRPTWPSRAGSRRLSRRVCSNIRVRASLNGNYEAAKVAAKLQRGSRPITRELLWRVHAAIQNAGLGIADLPINRTTWQRWHDAVRHQPAGRRATLVRPSTLKAIAARCSVSLEDLLHRPVLTFRGLDEAANQIDGRVLTLTRSLSDATPDAVKEAYRDHISSKLSDFRMKVDAFLQVVNDPELVHAVAQTVPKPGLGVVANDDFSDLVFTAPQGPPLRVRRPELLWDCFGGRGGRECVNRRCPIHSQPNAALITKSMREAVVEVRWRGASILWQQGPAFWPPSRDSFELVKRIEQQLPNVLATCRTMLDVGAGTGFLGIVLSRACPRLRRLELADWLLRPALFSAVNWWRNHDPAAEVRCRVLLGMHTTWFGMTGGAERRDLVVCNPPYLPALAGFEAIGTHAVVGGTDLLEHVVTSAPTLGKCVVLQYSRLASPEAERTRKRAGVQLKKLGRDVRVPFRVLRAFELNGYVSALRQRRELDTSPLGKRGHRYWHWLTTRRVVSGVTAAGRARKLANRRNS